jgi:hypothetical protein
VASAKTFYKPGDTIRLSIMFDGPDAEEINVLNLGSDG